MYRISSCDRSYKAFKIVNNKTGETYFKDFIDPVENKLLNFDTFDTYYDNKNKKRIIIKNSPARNTSIAGVLLIKENKTYGKYKKGFLYKFVPDDCRLPIFLVAYSPKIGFIKNMNNRYVVIYFKNWDDKHPIGVIDQNIGEVGDLPSFYQYQLYCRSLNSSIQDFKKAALEKVKQAPEDEIVENMIKKYNVLDRRKERVITVDPSTTRDFDDGLSYTIIDDNMARLSIYIANVPIWMDYLSLWGSFSKRIATIYLPDRKLPMLPTILSDILCSLQKKCSRFSVGLDILVNSETGEVLKTEYKNVVVNVLKNLHYDSKEQIGDSTYKNVSAIVEKMNKKCKYMRKIKSSHNVIAYLMIFMNHLSAKMLSQNKTGIYRSMAMSKTTSFDMIENDEIKNFLDNWHSSGGNYNKYENLQEHEALNLDKYLHTTSPIRRLVDLLNIYNIQKTLKITEFTDEAENFYNIWTSDDRISFINETMRSIRKVQSECYLLNRCNEEPELLENIHTGFIFDKMKRTDLMFQYQVYLPDIKIVKKLISVTEMDVNTLNEFKLYLFMDDERFYNKIRIMEASS